MKRAISLFFGVTLSILFTAVSAQAHDVKDPVCRMMVDSDTARYKHKLGNKTFYFCSDRCQLARESDILHDTPGRLRLAVPGILGSKARAQACASAVWTIPGIRYAAANALTGNLRVIYHAPSR